MAKKRVQKTVLASGAATNKAVIGTFTGKCCDGAVFNNNGMKLNRELFENLIASDEYKDAMEHRYYIGFLGHPEDPNCQKFQDACIVMTDMQIEDNDEIAGTFDLLNTPVGQVVKTLIDAGIELGISIRGAGDLDSEGNVDPETFVFRGFDLVAFPAYVDAVPEFMEIAASSDPKYKKIKAAIETNLQYISSASAISELQATLNPHSAEYKKLEARKADIGVAEDDSECDQDTKEDVLAKKLESMTELYMSECDRNNELEAALASAQCELRKVTASYNRQIRSLKRITASQNELMQDRLKQITASCATANRKNYKLQNSLDEANDKLSKVQASKAQLQSEHNKIVKELSDVNQSNLIYKQKIASSSADIKDRDATISSLQDKLDKTVVASTNAKREASNRDEEVRQLESQISTSDKIISELENRVVACEEMLHQYQQAYADFYATAVGTSVSGLPVTASTSVRELEHLIQGATNTANITAMPAYGVDDDQDELGSLVGITDDIDDNTLATL